MRVNDLTGKRFHRLLVLYRDKSINKHTAYRCLCDCGVEKTIAYNSLVNGHTKSCGCWGREVKGQSTKIPMVGKKYNKLTVLEEIPERVKSKIMYKCICDCGNTTIVAGRDLRTGNVKSCGCIGHKNKDVPHPRHGLSKHPLFHAWGGVLQRCYTKSAINYQNYGGRGIAVCDEWRYDFLSFYNWSLDNGWRKGLTLDRINPNGDYSPDNCRWVTQAVQNHNKRNSLPPVTLFGKTMYLQDWATEYGMNYSTVLSRINRGWSVEKALLTPPRQ